MKIFLAALLIVSVTTKATEDSGKQGSLPADNSQSGNSNLHQTNGTEISFGNNGATNLPSSEVLLPPFSDLFVRAPGPETIPATDTVKMVPYNLQSPNFLDDQQPQGNGNLPTRPLIVRLVTVPETVPRTDEGKRLVPVPVRSYLPMDISRPDPVEVDRTVLVYLLETIPQPSPEPSPAEPRRLGSGNGPYGGMFPTGNFRHDYDNHGQQVDFNRGHANLFTHSDLTAQNNGYRYKTPSKFWSN